MFCMQNICKYDQNYIQSFLTWFRVKYLWFDRTHVSPSVSFFSNFLDHPFKHVPGINTFLVLNSNYATHWNHISVGWWPYITWGYRVLDKQYVMVNNGRKESNVCQKLTKAISWSLTKYLCRQVESSNNLQLHSTHTVPLAA